MASANIRKPCFKCSKGAGVAICDGCQESFCIKHFSEHRQELAHLLEHIGQEHDLLRRDIDQQPTAQILFDRINTWEQQSIAKIQIVAQTARNDLRELLDTDKEELKKSMSRITEELHSCRESYDYTEMDINKWTQQLEVLRRMLESSSSICITENEIPKPRIHLIRVCNDQQLLSSNFAMKHPQHSTDASSDELNSFSFYEIFDEIDGKARISDDKLLATCYSKTFLFPTIIYGGNRYSTGTHHIRFRIENIGSSIFFGISTSSEKVRRSDVFDKSLYGWWDLSRPVIAGELQKNGDKKSANIGDEVMLTMDCDNRQIHLQHHQTNQLVTVTVDVDNCPFPWKTVVKLRSENDTIRILP